jgi:hypothetical protein
MHMRGVEGTRTDIAHIIVTGVNVLHYLLDMGFETAALAWGTDRGGPGPNVR